MKPFFTIHAGEYLVGSYIESNFKDINLWIPSKDSGIDLLLTNQDNTKTVSIQVKFSKDFLTTSMSDIFQKGLRVCGWWTLNREKIKLSKADFWIFALHRFNSNDLQFIIIEPDRLITLFDNLNRKGKTIQSYIWVTEKLKAWETRYLKKQDQILIANHAYNDPIRDLSKYLNNWETVFKNLK